MATKAVILIETTVGRTRQVANTLKNVRGIQSADVVTGPYDVIAVIDAPDLSTVGRVVEREIHTLDGVARTVTCVAVSA